MAQIRNFTSTNDSYFVLDGVSYPKVYEAMLDSGYAKDRIKLVGTNRDNSPLVFSTHYLNIKVDGVSFANAQEAISRLNQVVFNKGGGSGGGGTFEGIITEDSATVNFTGNGKVGSPLKANNIDTYSTTETLTGGTWIDGKPIYRKIIQFQGDDTSEEISIDISNLNIDKCIDYSGTFDDGSDIMIPINYFNSAINFILKNYKTSLWVGGNGEILGTNYKADIIFLYTKTTDIA